MDTATVMRPVMPTIQDMLTIPDILTIRVTVLPLAAPDLTTGTATGFLIRIAPQLRRITTTRRLRRIIRRLHNTAIRTERRQQFREAGVSAPAFLCLVLSEA